MKNQLIVFQLISSLLSITCFGSEIGVPVLLWQQKTDSLLFDSKSTINQIDGKILAEDYLENSQTIVAFIQNRLSLEQFTTEDEERLTAVKSIFRDQTIKPTLLLDVLNPTEALNQKHFQRQKCDEIHVKNGDKVWIELPEDSLAENNQLLTDLMAEIQKNVSKKALFLITGHQNEYQSIDLEPQMTEEHRRQKRALPTDEEESVDEYLFSVDDCLHFYTTSLTLYNNTGVPHMLAQYNTNKTYTKNHNSRCWVLANNTNTVDPGLLHLSYKDDNGTQLTLKLFIENKGRQYFWGIDTINSTVSVKSDHYEELKSEINFKIIDNEIESDQGFGYSCGQSTVFCKSISANGSADGKMSISMTFTRLQLQPFVNPFNKKGSKFNLVFTESFDCQVWMTLPLWMGLLTLIVMFMILSTGVYFIAIVNTPDRFENPKAKPLVITAIED